MNLFQESLRKSIEKKKGHFDTMFGFGERMRACMELETKDLASIDMSWEIRGFTLSIRSFPQNAWRPTIVAMPLGVNGSSVGYSNNIECPPESWYYSPEGTATVFYPPKAIQDIIIGRIKDKLGETV